MNDVPNAVTEKRDSTAKQRDASREWKRRNPDKVYAQHRAWADKHKVKRAAYARKRRAEMKARYAAHRGQRAARKLGNPVVDPQAVVQWMEDWHKKEIVLCYWCAKQFQPHECQADHVVPLWKGGAHSLENLVICCERCNRLKNKTMPNKWKAKIAKRKAVELIQPMLPLLR